MANIFGKKWTRQALLAHVGDIAQIAGVRLAELSDGPGRGVRIAEFYTGSGFEFTVLLDRGLDIHDASLKGTPLAFTSALGPSHPAFYDPAGTGWLRNFHGGWLNTCGLTNVGVPGEDALGAFGMHGFASNLPARLIGYGGEWRSDDYEIWVEASLRETAFFGVNLQLTRRISALLGQSELQITDRVENFGDDEAPFMLLYHCNFGFPVVAAGSRLVVNQKSVQPRDAAAKPGLGSHLEMDPPQAGYAEQVFFHQLNADEHGFVTAAVVNDAIALAGTVCYRQAELPNLIQWKQMGRGTYVLGLEPANCLVLGRAAERQRGTLQMLQPGESREMVLRLGAVEGLEAIRALVDRIRPGE